MLIVVPLAELVDAVLIIAICMTCYVTLTQDQVSCTGAWKFELFLVISFILEDPKVVWDLVSDKRQIWFCQDKVKNMYENESVYNTYYYDWWTQMVWLNAVRSYKCKELVDSTVCCYQYY